MLRLGYYSLEGFSEHGSIEVNGRLGTAKREIFLLFSSSRNPKEGEEGATRNDSSSSNLQFLIVTFINVEFHSFTRNQSL